MKDTYGDKQRPSEEAIRDLPPLHEILIIHEQWELGNSVLVKASERATLHPFNCPGFGMMSASNGLKSESREDKLRWVRIKGSDMLGRAQKAGSYVVRETAGSLDTPRVCHD